MKPAATLIVIAGLAGVGAAGYYIYSTEAYAGAVDVRVEREIEDADLSIIRAELAGDSAGYLRELYRGPANGELNLRYARLVSNWLQAYPRLARIPMLPDRLTGAERLGAEIDERVGPGPPRSCRTNTSVIAARRRNAMRRDWPPRRKRARRQIGSTAISRTTIAPTVRCRMRFQPTLSLCAADP
jgi:hypothetical protein